MLNQVIAREGRRIKGSARDPIRLEYPEVVYVVASGHVDLFLVKAGDSDREGMRFHMARVNAGHGLFGFPRVAEKRDAVILAVPGQGTVLIQLSFVTVESLTQRPEFTQLMGQFLDAWVGDLSAELAASLHDPQASFRMKAAERTDLKDGDLVQPAEGVLWITQLEGTSRLMGDADFPLITAGQTVPISSVAWLVSEGPGQISAETSESRIKNHQDLRKDLASFHSLMSDVMMCRLGRIEQRQTRQLSDSMEADANRREAVLSSLRKVLVKERDEFGEQLPTDLLLQTCRMIGNHMGIAIRAPHTDSVNRMQPLQAIAEASKISIREVILKGNWWAQDLGSLLGFMAEDNRPVALLDKKPGTYVLYDLSNGTKTHLTAECASRLNTKAWMFVRPFPHKPLAARDVMRFGLQGCRKDIVRTLLMAIAAGMLSLATPLATSMLFDQIIPSENHSQLLRLVAVLSVAFVSLTLFQLVQALAQIRVESKTVWSLQCAIWDRILALPVPFFRQFSAGDLANRSMSMDRIRQIVSGTALTTIVTGVFSGLQLGLLFYYSVELAMVAVVLGMVLAIVPAVCLFMQHGYQTSLYQIIGRIQGVGVQLLGGIPKLRVHAAEERAFDMWAALFAQQRAISFRSGRLNNLLVAYSQSFGLVGTLVILVWIFWTDDRALQTMSAGGFLAFVSAFTIVLTSAHSMLLTLYPLVSVKSLFRRTQPILQTLPEAPAGKAYPGELHGHVELSQVSFRYQRGGPLVVKGLSLQVKPGEFLALVGPSGSGKSTLLRLLLGFEQPESGSILYDRQALNQLDVQAVRRQIGVVLQNSTLMAGSIFENIVGSAPLTVDDAWEAVRKVDLEDAIKTMPMGIYTIIGEGGAGLSGGERQRLLMARALVRRPRLLFFDEATSALDNQSQAWVSKNLEGLGITRVVIAQRLSTTRHADRICVVVDGRIVEIGSFDLLMSKGKVFPILAKRQLS